MAGILVEAAVDSLAAAERAVSEVVRCSGVTQVHARATQPGVVAAISALLGPYGEA
ncbi:MAG: hypothetical protein ACT4R6_02620 [Gemmatimonadaceae bacterium]